jgi:hypothetical protein
MVVLRKWEWEVDRELAPVREFALMTQSWSLARWVVATYVSTFLVHVALPTLALLVFFVVNGIAPTRSLAFVLVYTGVHAACALLLFRVRRNIYRYGVVASFHKMLPTRMSVEQYSTNRWACTVNGLYNSQRTGTLGTIDGDSMLRTLTNIQPHTELIGMGCGPRGDSKAVASREDPSLSNSVGNNAGKRTKRKSKAR